MGFYPVVFKIVGEWKLMEYIHFTRECRNCGALTQVNIDSGICPNCQHVLDFYHYDAYGDFYEDDEWHGYNCICEECIQNYPERYYFRDPIVIGDYSDYWADEEE